MNINDQIKHFMTTYILYTQMYVAMITNINLPEQSIMTMYFCLTKRKKYYDKY